MRNCLAHATVPDNKTSLGKTISGLLTDSSALTEALEQIADRYYEQSRERHTS